MGPDSYRDGHDNNDDRWALLRNVDRPIAALVTDLKRHGLLDMNRIVGRSEFDRTPWQDQTPPQSRPP